MCYLILRGTFLSGSVNTRKVNSATSRRAIGLGANLPVFGRRWINQCLMHGQCGARLIHDGWEKFATYD